MPTPQRIVEQLMKLSSKPGFQKHPDMCSKLKGFVQVMRKLNPTIPADMHSAVGNDLEKIHRILGQFAVNGVSKEEVETLLNDLGQITRQLSPSECMDHIAKARQWLDASIKGHQVTRRAEQRGDNQVRGDLRETLAALEAAGVIELQKPVDQLSTEELGHLAVRHDSLLQLTVFSLIERYNNARQKCDKCKNSGSTTLPRRTCKQPTAIPPIPGLFPVGAVDYTEVDAHGFQIYTHGTVCGTIGKRGTPDFQICIMLKFVSGEELEESPERLEQWKKLARLFFEAAKHCTVVKNNSAHINAGSIGVMSVIGWRGGYNEENYALYYPTSKAQCSKEEWEIWDRLQQEMTFIRDMFLKEFEILASSVTSETVEAISELGVPAFGDTDADITTHKPSLGSNFTVSHSGFANEAHFDNDAHKYVFSVYIFIDQEGNLVTDRDRIKECMKGGYFIWPDIHLGVDPSAFPGVLIFLWRGNHERHCTTTSELMDNGVMRYGSSMQVNQQLVHRVAKATGLGVGLEEHRGNFMPVDSPSLASIGA